MITPDGGGASPPGQEKKRQAPLIGIGALVVFVGLVLVGTLSSREPEAAEETTTTRTALTDVDPPIDVENFTIAQISAGEPLEWQLTMAIDDHYPLELVEHGGTLYLFTGSVPARGPEAIGLRAWRSRDGTSWEDLGDVITADHRITTVDSTVQGLVATSTRLEDNALIVWESEDGVEWAGSEISVHPEDHHYADVASAVGADETTLMVASKRGYDRESLLEDRLLDLGVDLDLSTIQWRLQWLGGQGHELIVRAPLGIPILRQPIDELDLTEAERNELLSELYDPLGTDVWFRRGEEWQATSIGDARSIDSILTTTDGDLIAYGSGAFGRLAKTTDIGTNWATVEMGVSPWLIEVWRGGLVGATSPPDLMISDDGESWQPAGLADRFPGELGWAPITLGAGEGGVAMFVRGSRVAPEPREPAPSELTADDGTTYTLDPEGSGYHLTSEDGSHRWSFDNSQPLEMPDSVDVDLPARTLTLLDDGTRRPVATFTFAEIERARHQGLMSSPLYQLWGALVFSDSGDEWTIQDMDPEIGERATIWLLEVTADRVVAVVSNALDSIPGGSDPGLEIWSAPIP